MHIVICIYINIYVNICICTYVYVYVHMYMYICICICMCICIHIYMYICKRGAEGGRRGGRGAAPLPRPGTTLNSSGRANLIFVVGFGDLAPVRARSAALFSPLATSPTSGGSTHRTGRAGRGGAFCNVFSSQKRTFLS